MKVRKQKGRRLSGVQVVCYSRRGRSRQHGGNESTCERRRARKANYPGRCSGLNPRPVSQLAPCQLAPISARNCLVGMRALRGRENWKESSRIARATCSKCRQPVLMLITPANGPDNAGIRGRMNKFSPRYFTVGRFVCEHFEPRKSILIRSATYNICRFNHSFFLALFRDNLCSTKLWEEDYHLLNLFSIY